MKCSTCGAPLTLLDVSCRYCRTAVAIVRTDRVLSDSDLRALRSEFYAGAVARAVLTPNEARQFYGMGEL